MQRPCAELMSSQPAQIPDMSARQAAMLQQVSRGTMIPTCEVSCRVTFGIIPRDQLLHGHLRIFPDANPLHVLLDHIQDHLLHETWKQSHTASRPAMPLLSL